MNMPGFQIVTPSSIEPLTLDEAKGHLRVDISDDDALITAMVKAAREYAESYTHRALLTQTWKYYVHEWPRDPYKQWIDLPFPPLQSVASVVYQDCNGLNWTWSTSQYQVDAVSEPGRVLLAYQCAWPSVTLNVGNPICITFSCGYGTPDDIPEGIKLGMKVDLTDLYDHRGEILAGVGVQHLKTVDRLYSQFKTFEF